MDLLAVTAVPRQALHLYIQQGEPSTTSAAAVIMLPVRVNALELRLERTLVSHHFPRPLLVSEQRLRIVQGQALRQLSAEKAAGEA